MAQTKPRTFVKTIDGREAVQFAHSPADAVRLSFNGWRERVERPAAAPRARPAVKKAAAAAKPTDRPVEKPVEKTSK